MRIQKRWRTSVRRQQVVQSVCNSSSFVCFVSLQFCYLQLKSILLRPRHGSRWLQNKAFTTYLVSIVSGLIIMWLFISEFMYFLSVEVRPQLSVDTSRGEKLRINMDITFHNLPCACIL